MAAETLDFVFVMSPYGIQSDFTFTTWSAGALAKSISWGKGNINISKNGGAFSATTNSPTEIAASGIHKLRLISTEMQAAVIIIKITNAAIIDCTIHINTQGNAFGHVIKFDSNLIQVDGVELATHGSGRTPADVRMVDGVALDTHDAGKFPGDLRMIDGVALVAHNAGEVPADPLTNAVASVTGAVGSVTGAVGSVTGSVGSVTGAVGSVTGAVGSVTANVSADVVQVDGSALAGHNAGEFPADPLTNPIASVTDLSPAQVAEQVTVAAGSSTTEVRTDSTKADGFYDDMFLVVVNAAGTASRRISGYLNANGAFTVGALPFTPAAADVAYVMSAPEPSSGGTVDANLIQVDGVVLSPHLAGHVPADLLAIDGDTGQTASLASIKSLVQAILGLTV